MKNNLTGCFNSFLCEISSDNQFSLALGAYLKAEQFAGGRFLISHQAPLLQHSQADDFFAVLFGRIFNLQDLMSDFSLGQKALSDIDQIVFLRMLSGKQVLQRFRGDFVLCLVNKHTLELELVKSPYSLKNLYFLYSTSGIVFSNSLPALRQVSSAPFTISKVKVIDELAETYALANQSFYQNVFYLEGGQFVSWSPENGIRKTRVWSPERVSCLSQSDTSYAEGLKEQLDRAVRRQLEQDVAVCCEISGGLDSTSVAAVLARNSQKLIGFSERTSLEDALNLTLPKELTNAHLLSDFLDMYPETQMDYYSGLSCQKNYSEITRFCFDHACGPLGRAIPNVLWILSFHERAAQYGVRKLFSGRKGDMAFSFRYALTRPSPWKEIRESIGNAKRFLQGKPCDRQLKSLLNTDIKILPSPFLVLNQIRDLSQKRFAILNFVRTYSTALSSVDAAALTCFGTELCDPTADLDLIEYCLSIPVEAYQRNGLNRYVTREAIKGLVPESVRLNKIKGTQGAYWHVPLQREIGYYKSLIPKFAKNELIAELVDLPRMQRLLNEFEHWSIHKLTRDHRVSLLHALHVCEWILLHDHR